jgi:hypothetical protein
MNDLIPNRRYQQNKDPVFSMAPICGFRGCRQETAINIAKHHVTRCNHHYSMDLSAHETGIRPKPSKSQFVAEIHIMKELHKIGMDQKQGESKREYSDRCKKLALETMGGLLPMSLKDTSGS